MPCANESDFVDMDYEYPSSKMNNKFFYSEYSIKSILDHVCLIVIMLVLCLCPSVWPVCLMQNVFM